jgi:uncharacterized protein (TIGR02588 family)
MTAPRKNWIEWSVFALSALLISFVIGFLVYESATIGNAPPDIRVQLGPPEARAGYFAVPVEATNSGDQTAEGVQIEVTLQTGGKEETGSFEIAFLPRRGSREAWVTFKTIRGKARWKRACLATRSRSHG